MPESDLLIDQPNAESKSSIPEPQSDEEFYDLMEDMMVDTHECDTYKKDEIMSNSVLLDVNHDTNLSVHDLSYRGDSTNAGQNVSHDAENASAFISDCIAMQDVDEPKINIYLEVKSQSKAIKKIVTQKIESKCTDKKVDKHISNSHKCPICHLEFKKVQLLSLHLNRVHPGQNSQFGEMTPRCNDRQGLREVLKTSKDLAQVICPEADLKKIRLLATKIQK